MPPHCTRALDIGCGGGGFARVLASRGIAVDAIGPAPLPSLARERTPSRLSTDYRVASTPKRRAARAAHVKDLTTSLTALGPQWAIGVGMVLGRAITGIPDPHGVGPTAQTPMRVPEMSLREIAAETAALLLGARLRRSLSWRCPLVYIRPA